jgi:predicted nucleic acid-binding protein
VQRNELTTPEALIDGRRRLQRAELELMPMRALLEPATRLAIALGHPAYDCIYLALAESMTCDLVTADRKLAATVLPAGHDFRVLALATIDLP